MRTYLASRLSEHIGKTPEGYLLCEGVALARTGVMAYAPDEVPEDVVEDFDGHMVMVSREATEVFRPETLASFEGKPFTLDHPDEDVSPENWNELAQGVVFHVRRGVGQARDLILADILITGAEAIRAVLEGGLRELSCGYDAHVERVSPGVGRQVNIMGNHVALVDHGRAGGRCKIYDTESDMKNAVKGKAGSRKGLMDKLRRLLKDAEAEEAPKDEGTPPAQDEENAPVAATDTDVAAKLEEIGLQVATILEILQKAVVTGDEGTTGDEEPGEQPNDEEPAADEEPTGDEGEGGDCDPAQDEDEPARAADRRPRTADSATVRDARRMGLLGARVGDNADAVRRSALMVACRDAETRRMVNGILRKPLPRAGAAEIRAAFQAVAMLGAAANNRRTTDSLARPGAGGASRAFTPAYINKLNAEFYGGKGGK